MRNFSKKTVVLVVSLALLLCMGIGGTLAYLFDTSREITNTFTPSKVTTIVEEELEGDTKKNVTIGNTGDTEAYIRAAVVVTWQNSAGEVAGVVPVLGTDYSIVFNTDAQEDPIGKWEKNGSFYYWSKPVAPGEGTGILITSCTPVEGKAPNGYNLCVEIIGSGIQSTPKQARTEAGWYIPE